MLYRYTYNQSRRREPNGLATPVSSRLFPLEEEFRHDLLEADRSFFPQRRTYRLMFM